MACRHQLFDGRRDTGNDRRVVGDVGEGQIGSEAHLPGAVDTDQFVLEARDRHPDDESAFGVQLQAGAVAARPVLHGLFPGLLDQAGIDQFRDDARHPHGGQARALDDFRPRAFFGGDQAQHHPAVVPAQGGAAE